MGRKRATNGEQKNGKKPFLQRLVLQNFLSFKNETEIELGNLNVLIGANASGKSNLIEAVALLKSCPADLSWVFAEGGSFNEWPHKQSEKNEPLRVTAFSTAADGSLMHHLISMRRAGSSYEIIDEQLDVHNDRPVFHHRGGALSRWLNRKEDRISLPQGNSSVLSISGSLQSVPEIRDTIDSYNSIQISRDWRFGRSNMARQLASADLRGDTLRDDGHNLVNVLNNLQRGSELKQLISILRELYPGIDGIKFITTGGLVLMYVEEEAGDISTTRLSDGTLRFLALLALLFQPNPPRLLCIEEPELGLHPDVQAQLANLLVEASGRMQLIVTTHSEMVVSALSEHVRSVVVCEKVDGSTKVQRLDQEKLARWLKEYSLGDLWIRGHIGGTRW